MKTKKWSTKTLIRISLLSAMAYILFYFEIIIPPFPEFLKLDTSDVPAIIAAYIIGPVPAIMVELIKNILHMLLNGKTGGIGELANFIVGVAYIIPLSFFIRKNLNTTSIILGSLAGTLCMVIVACIFNYFILIPLYLNLAPKETFTLIIASIMPFNAVKGIILGILGYLCLTALKPFMKLFTD